MYDGARALYDFFETMRADRTASPKDIAEKLKTEYGLTSNQQKYLDNVAERTSKAKVIVQYLEHRFGLNDDGTFKDAQGLHKLLFNGKVRKRIKAVSYNFGIGFTQGYWGCDEFLGYKNKVLGGTCLSESPRKTISKLERGINNDCMDIAFHLPSDTRMDRTAAKIYDARTQEEKMLQAIFGGRLSTNPEGLRAQVIDHELKHVIDTIIGDSWHGFFVETPAHMYAGENLDWGLTRDFNRTKKLLTEETQVAQKQIEKDESNPEFPDWLLEMDRKILSNRQRGLERLESEFPEQMNIFRRFRKRRFSRDLSSLEGCRVNSYLFSTMPPEKLFRRINQISFAQPEEVELEEGK